MSMYFDIGDVTLRNPSNGAGHLFLRQVQVFEAELKLLSGIGQGKHEGDPDTLEVDPVAYEEFIRSLDVWHCRTVHSVIIALSEGFVATALALARRAGMGLEMPEPAVERVPAGVQHDVQIPGNPRARSSAVVSALDARAREISLHGVLSGASEAGS